MKPTASFEKADALYDSGRFNDAFKMFVELCNAGDAASCSRVAIMYGDGRGVEYDFEKSVEWDLRALELGNVSSLLNLGVTFRTHGAAREARKYFERAIAAGDGDAMLELAKLLDVSDFETANVLRLLRLMLESDSVTEGSREEASSLVTEIERRGSR